MYSKYFKRLFDIIFAVLMMPILILIFLVIGLLIFCEDRGPIFYKAPRRGRNGSVFKIYKLRSMKVNAEDIRNADGSTYNSKNDSRVTKIGRFIRKTSIDELPQIINVLKGEMSVIGPRPITIDKPLNEYDEKRRIRLQVLPGITGYSQAYFRNTKPQEEKFEYDAEYAQNVSLLLDIKILFLTIKTVLLRKNIYRN